MGPRAQGMRPPEQTLAEKTPLPGANPDDEATPAAAVSRFAQNSDEMAAALRAQFRRRADVADKLENAGEHFDRVLEDDVVPRANAVQNLAGQAGRSLAWLLAQAREHLPDDSDLVLVLRQLLQRQHLPAATRQRLTAILQSLQAQAAPKRLKAGINCALKARLFGKSMALRPGLLRETYRSFLEQQGDALDSYEDWIALYGFAQRSPVLDFIEAALLCDIDALDPSCSRLEFGALLNLLGQLKTLRSADAGFVLRLVNDDWIAGFNGSEADWLVFLLGLLRWPDELGQLLHDLLGDRLLDTGQAERGALLYQLRLTCAQLPPVLYGDEQAPLRVAAQFERLSGLAQARELIERHAAAAR